MAAMTGANASTPDSAAEPRVVTYKQIDGLELRADVWGAEPGARKPLAVWLHGGALILGSRRSLIRRFHERLLELPGVVASIDYRLAPETKLPAIIEDVTDFFRWVETQGSRELGIDPARIAIAGGSAGGYLTLMTGFRVRPRPRALVSFYGYGDITTPWYAEPDGFYRKQALVTEEEARCSVGTQPLAEPPEGSERGKFYLYSRQQGIWPQEVAGRDPRRDPRWFDEYCPIRNVSESYPPTLLVHGTADTDVPYEESRAMAARLMEAGVEHQLLTMEGVGHGLIGADVEEADAVYRRAAEWIRVHA
jgi:acetyl esterase/lipase